MGTKKGLLIVRRVVVGLLLGLYVMVALLNSTVVQSYLGAIVGSHFSKEWGGKVRVGALHFSPFSHIILNKIELISPTNDTIYYGDRIACRFSHFPFHKDGLNFDMVYLRNGRYHFESLRRADGRMGTNLDFIIDHYATERQPRQAPTHFIVEVGELRMRNIDYIQDLPEPTNMTHFEHGVEIAHMRYLGTSGHIRHVRVDNDSVTCRVVSLSTTEASGMRVEDLSMDVEVSPHTIHVTNMDLQTADSRVFMDVEMLYHGWEEMDDYCNTVRHDVVLKPGTEVNLCDAAYWAPVLWGLNEKVTIQGHFYGPISNLHASNVVASFGENSDLFLNATISGLPLIDRTYIDANLHRLHVTYNDIAAVQLPESVQLTLPTVLKQMHTIDVDGSLRGSLLDCETFFNANSHIGDLEGYAHIQYDTVSHDYTYIGDLDSRVLGIRSLIPNEWVSRTGFHLSFQGTGFDPKSMEAALEGRLYNTQFRGHNLNRTTLSAELSGNVFSADIDLRDSLIDIDLTASANMAEKRYNADLFLTNAHLTRLGLLESDSDVTVTTHLVADLLGDSIENMTGNVALHNTHSTIGSRTIDLKKMELDATQRNQYKRLTLNSDWMAATVRGYFKYKDVPLVVRDFCDHYLPTYINPYKEADTAYWTPLLEDNINIDIAWNDEGGTFQRFIPEVAIASGTNLRANYAYGEGLKTVFRSEMLAYNNIALHDIGFNSSRSGDNYQLNITASNIALGEAPLLENLQMTATMGSTISTLALLWDDDARTSYNEGDIELFLNSSATDNKVMITHPTFYIKGQRWNLVCPKGILANRDRLLVEELKVYGLGQSMAVNALVAGNEADYVQARFDDFSLGELCTTLIPNNKLKIDGAIDGTLEMRGIAQRPYIDANLVVDNCIINGQEAGRLDIASNYKTDEGRLYLDLRSDYTADDILRHPLVLHGSASLLESGGDLDFDLNLDHIGLQAVKPFLADVISDIDGYVSGQLTMEGSVKELKINGKVAIEEGLLNLIPTGVTYLFDDTLTVSNSILTLDNFTINDLDENHARIDGTLAYVANDLMLDLALHTDGITMLDKDAEGEGYYGQLFGSVHGTVTGPVNKLNINANATALDGSEIYVPISNKKEINENEFIIFVNPERQRSPQAARPTTAQSNTSDLDLQLNVSITPGMKLHLPMDFQQLAANVTAVGHGDLKVSMHGNQEPLVLGDYQFTSGNFSLMLMQLIGKNFAIEQGSTLNFPGNINDARFNINAVYNLRANLATLMGSNISDNYVTVQDVITLSGTWEEPVIKFDIRLPNSEQSVVDQVFSYIDKKNEMELLNQSVSLLLFGQFTSSNSNTTETAEGINGIGLLTSSVGTLVSSMVKFVDVDFNYQAATANTSSQWDVGISKRWNKLYFESTFGYGTNSELDAAMANVLVGDVEMGYRFTPFFNFYGFHRTNTSYFTRNELPYKQGIGIKLSKDFDSFYDLFPWLKPKQPAVKPIKSDLKPLDL